ncbi:MAG: hypothetical protein IKQ17_07335 [Kiritimatiellae bacterium]|nr:hypothetical protein [Kiritimatiellia bacterium]
MMNDRLGNIVRFEIDRLFNGAVDVDWLQKDAPKAERAAGSFVFHGPGTHGVAAAVAEGTGHRLVDTATFAADVAEDLANPGSRPFTLAIASYGSGKSHLAVTLSELFSAPDGETARDILGNIAKADEKIAGRIDDSIRELDGQVLVLTVNGMNNADLASVLLAQLKERIATDGHSVEPLESLRQRFHIAANMLGNISPELSAAFVKDAGVASVDECKTRLLAFDEAFYERAQAFFRTIGLPIQTIGDETVKDVLERVAGEYIGPDKPYSRLLILFDEFGHYLEFAAAKPQVAGDGALQHLFEGVQAHSDCMTFVGFIQFELKAYLQRLGTMTRNEANRYVTRYDSAEKYYLSSNLETLVASLLVKTEAPSLAPEDVSASQARLLGWYESAKHASSWTDATSFAKIAAGCWPLSPEAMWVLYYLSSSGRFLQQRSALSLLKAALALHQDDILDADYPALPPVALWTTELHDEFVEMESGIGAASTVVQSYDTVFERNAQHFSDEETAVLRALVLIEQTKLRATDRDDMIGAVAVFAGLHREEASAHLKDLEDEKNVIAWEWSFRRFEILTDTASRAQFHRYLRKKAEEYDDDRRGSLFVGHAPGIELLNGELGCDFGEEHKIQTREWDFEPRFSTWGLFRLSVANLAAELRARSQYQAIAEKRGFVVYCFVPDNEDEATVLDEARRMLRAQCSKVPFLLVLLFDKEHRISDPLVQLDLLASLADREREQFDRLVQNQQRGQIELLGQAVKDAVLERYVLSGVTLDVAPKRLRAFGDAIFEKLFPKIVPFPFDGFTTKGGVSQASKDCAEFTRALFLTDFTFVTTQSMGVQKRNRAQKVLHHSWALFAPDGAVSFRRAISPVKSLMEEWNKALFSDDGLSATAALEIACGAPYGANIASAGLLLAAFYRAHANVKGIQSMADGEAVSVEALAPLLSERTALDPGEIKEVRFVRAVSGEDSPWVSIADEWSDCISYREKVSFEDRIVRLRSTHPVVPPTLRIKIQDIERGIAGAKQAIEDVDRKESEHLNRIVTATRREDAYQLAFGLSLLADDLKAKMFQPHLWDRASDIDPLETEIREGRQRVAQWFSAWLQSFNPRGDGPDAIAEYRKTANERMGRSLRNLGMASEEEQLKKRVERVLKHLNAIADARARKREAEAWCESHLVVPDNLPCAQMDAWKAECEQHRKVLQGCAASMRMVNPGIADEIGIVYKQLNDIREALDKSRKALDRRAGAVLSRELTRETARDILDEIEMILRLYEGTGKNQEDFRDARNEVDAYLTLVGVLSGSETTEEAFRERIEQAKIDFVEKYVEIEPNWDPQEVFDELVSTCEKERAQASKAWVARMLEKYADPSELSAQETIAAQNEIARRIPFFNPKDAAKLLPIEKALARRNDTLGVDSLVAQFNALSSAAKKQFLQKIQAHK